MWNLSLAALYCWILFATYAQIVPQCEIHVHNQPSRPCGQVRRSYMCCHEPKNAVEVSSEQKEDSMFANVTFPVNINDEDIFLVEGGDTCVTPHECWEVFLNGPNCTPAPDRGQPATVILVFPKTGSYHDLGPGVEYQVSVTSSVTSDDISDRNEDCDRLSRSKLNFKLRDTGGSLVLYNGSEPFPRGDFPDLKVTLFSASCKLDCGDPTPLFTCGKDLPLDQFQHQEFNWTRPNSIELAIPREDLVHNKTGVPLQFHCVLVELAHQNWCKVRTTTLEWDECSRNPCVTGPVPLEASPGFVVLVSALLSVGVLFASMAVLLFCRRVAARRTSPEDGSLGVPPLLGDLASGLEAVDREPLQLPRVLLLYVDDLRDIKHLMRDFARTLQVAGVQEVLDPHHGSSLREVLEDKKDWWQKQLRQLSDGKLHVLLVATQTARDLDRGVDPKPNTHHELFKLALAGIRSDSSINQYVTQISMDGDVLKDVCPCHILSQNLNLDSLVHVVNDLLCERIPLTEKYVFQLRRLHESISKYRNSIKKAHLSSEDFR